MTPGFNSENLNSYKSVYIFLQGGILYVVGQNTLFIKSHFKNSRSLIFFLELNSKEKGTNWKLFSFVKFVFVVREILI